MLLPHDFTSYTSQLFGEELWQQYLQSFEEDTPVSIRLNKNTSAEDVKHLPLGEKIPWSEGGYYLTSRPQFTLDPLLHAGAYYVQEASSQYLDEVLRKVTADMKIEYAGDFCASPGGKSLILKDYLPSTATLISNEYVRKRAWILRENMDKGLMGLKTKDRPKVIVTNNATDELAASGILFDIIVCDVPCSGEGMFRKDHATIEQWSVENVQNCAALQKEIVTNAWKCLKTGGVLVYSTCTFNRYEDEENIDYITNTLGGEIIVEPRKFIPGKDRGEGQFMAAFRKTETFGGSTEVDADNIITQDNTSKKKNKKRVPQLNVVPSTMEDAITSDITVELTLEQAQQYLRGNALILPPDTPKGIVTVAYNGFLLGPAKNIGSRANNLYPKEWRIKHL